MEEDGLEKVFPKREVVRDGESGCHSLILLRARTLRQRLSNNADVVDAGDAERVDDRGKNAEGNGFVASQEDTWTEDLQWGVNFREERRKIDEIIGEIDEVGVFKDDNDTKQWNIFECGGHRRDGI